MFDSPNQGSRKNPQNHGSAKKPTAKSPQKPIQRKNAPHPASQPSKGNLRPSGRNVKRGKAVRTPEAAKHSKIKVHTVKSTERKKFPLAIVFGALSCTIVFMVMIWSFVQINEQTIKIESLERQLKTLVAEERELTFDLERKNNLTEIEEYAKTKLGMVQIDQLAKKYISVTYADKVELVDEEEKDDSGVFDIIIEKFEQLLEYFSLG